MRKDRLAVYSLGHTLLAFNCITLLGKNPYVLYYTSNCVSRSRLWFLWRTVACISLSDILIQSSHSRMLTMLQVGVRAHLSDEININTSLHGPRMCGCVGHLVRTLLNATALVARVAQFCLCGSARNRKLGEQWGLVDGRNANFCETMNWLTAA